MVNSYKIYTTVNLLFKIKKKTIELIKKNPSKCAGKIWEDIAKK